jgi:hypothetical protein
MRTLGAPPRRPAAGRAQAASADLSDVVDAYNQALVAVLTDLIPGTLKAAPRTS